MRFFICSFTKFLLAIPIQAVSSLMLHSGGAEQAVEYNEENGNTYFSLPHLFNVPEETIRHGIILKDPASTEDRQDDVIENRNILLTTEVERETDISDIEIYPPPRFCTGKSFASIFRGFRFTEARPAAGAGHGAASMVLILKSDYLAALARDNSRRIKGNMVPS